MPPLTMKVPRTSESPLSLEDSPYLLDRHGPIFIVGCPRSGTSFLSSCIGSIDQIEQFVGVLVPPRMMHQIGMRSEVHGEPAEELLWIVRDIFWQAFWRRIRFRAERAAQVVYRRKPWYWVLQRPTIEGRYFSYKEPFLAFAMRELAAHFPESKLVHIIRDGRDNADSMIRSYPHALSDRVLGDRSLALNKVSEIGIPRRFGERYVPWWIKEGEEEHFLACSQYGRYVWMWREMVSRVQNCGKQVGGGRYLELRYESIVSQPQENAEGILRFLGFDTSRSLLRRLGHGRVDSVGIGRKNQSAQFLDEAQAIAGPLLHSLNYA